MNTRELDRQRIESLLSAAVDKLEGEWLLVGGALVAVWLEPRRVTEDVDLIGLGGSASERMSLMELAEAEGLPIEAVNSAADFFVFRVPRWRDQIELFRSGARARIHRPSPTLFLLLKLGRLSEQDLADCLLLLRKVSADGLPIDTRRVIDTLEALPETADAALAARRTVLCTALGGTAR